MKRNFILFGAAAAIAYVTFSSNAAGPAHVSGMDRTTSTCGGTSGCHDAASGATVANMIITDSATGDRVTGSYQPGKTYVVTIGGTNTASYTKWGFQATVKESGGSTPGVISVLDAGTYIKALGSASYIEHSAPITAVATGAIIATFQWNAPKTGGTGPVTFYGAVNAVNGDANTTGDKPSDAFSVTLTEDASSVKELQTLVNNIYPNPANNMLSLSLQHIIAGNYTISVCDMFGRTISSEQRLLNSNASIATVDIAGLPKGNYLLQIQNSEARQAVPFVKL